VERLTRLVDDLLLLARVDDAGTAPRRAAEPVDLVEVATWAANRYATPHIQVSVTGDEAMLVGDQDAVRRVIANLVENAVRYATGQVTIHLGRQPDAVAVTVRDDGPGIPAAERERVFDRFTRLDDGRDRDSGGSGLGLAIVRELVKAAGGTVSLTEPDDDTGLVVRVTWPDGGQPSRAGRPARFTSL
jgi:signal transduction histidine kinase